MYQTVETFRTREAAVSYLKKLGFHLTPSLIFWRRGSDKVFIQTVGSAYQITMMI